MSYAYREPWTPEQDALLGTMTDAEVGRRIGKSGQNVYQRRLRLGISAYLPAGGAQLAARGSIEVSAELVAKLDELAPLIAAKFRAQGLPLSRVMPWQVVEFCVHQVLQQARKERTRALYAPQGGNGGESEHS